VLHNDFAKLLRTIDPFEPFSLFCFGRLRKPAANSGFTRRERPPIFWINRNLTRLAFKLGSQLLLDMIFAKLFKRKT
jgi:hypothetical protein